VREKCPVQSKGASRTFESITTRKGLESPNNPPCRAR